MVCKHNAELDIYKAKRKNRQNEVAGVNLNSLERTQGFPGITPRDWCPPEQDEDTEE